MPFEIAMSENSTEQRRHRDQFRSRYRAEHIGRFYNGWLHIGFILFGSMVAIVLCAGQTSLTSLAEWLTVPVTFLYMNFAEYFGHRGPMHHRRRGLGMIFNRHTLQHHRFFTYDNMPFDTSRDHKAVLFPPVLISFFLVAFALPFWFLIKALFSANAAWLSVATILAYYLQYELLHFAWHCRDDAWIYRIPGMRRWREYHRIHHDIRKMQTVNFNITVPLADLVMGTFKHQQ